MLKRFHPKLKKPMVVIQPGEYYVTKEDEVIATVLGSCISVCLKDERSGIAGMNHFMLPGDFRQADVFQSQSARYGMYAMELIVGDILKMGGGKEKLTAKVFGGGHVLASVAQSSVRVPDNNIEFVEAFLSMEGIEILKQDVGGVSGRQVLYLARSGKAFVRKLGEDKAKTVLDRERKYRSSLQREVRDEDLTLF